MLRTLNVTTLHKYIIPPKDSDRLIVFLDLILETDVDPICIIINEPQEYEHCIFILL